jgi:uncharacterized protein (DUF1778 family)
MPKTAKMARAPAKATKDDLIRVRVTVEQKRAMVAAAAADGLELSAWVRRLALRAAGALPAASPSARRKDDGD